MSLSSLALSINHSIKSRKRELNRLSSTALYNSRWCVSLTSKFQAVLILSSLQSKMRRIYQLRLKTSLNSIKSLAQQKWLQTTHRILISTNSTNEKLSPIMWIRKWTWHSKPLPMITDLITCPKLANLSRQLLQSKMTKLSLKLIFSLTNKCFHKISQALQLLNSKSGKMTNGLSMESHSFSDLRRWVGLQTWLERLKVTEKAMDKLILSFSKSLMMSLVLIAKIRVLRASEVMATLSKSLKLKLQWKSAQVALRDWWITHQKAAATWKQA